MLKGPDVHAIWWVGQLVGRAVSQPASQPASQPGNRRCPGDGPRRRYDASSGIEAEIAGLFRTLGKIFFTETHVNHALKLAFRILNV